MNSSPAAPVQRKRYRAGVLLLLFVVSASALARSLAGMVETAEKVGAICSTFALLVAGCWYAYQDGGRIARVCACVLATVTACSLGAGVIKGIGHQKATRAVDAELKEIRAGLIEETAEDGLGPDAARRNRERTLAAANRMKESDDAETAALGRIMESMSERSRAVEERLIAALEAVGSERFLKTETMLADKDFDWQRATAKEYGLAAKAALVVHDRLPRELDKDLAASDMSEAAAAAIKAGFNRGWSLSGRVYHAHAKTAKAESALIDLIEKRAAEIEVQEDGSLSFQTEESASAYNRMHDQVTAATAEIGAAVQALNAEITKH